MSFYRQRSPHLALLPLALRAFGLGTTEFVARGLLPDIAGEFGVSIPTAGWIVSAYALGVVVGVPVTTVLGTRLGRKTMLLLLLGLFLLGNRLSALAPTFGALLLGRLITS